ncbi:hypothetical protein MMC11_008996 [Xylographa trunciseda]|nr:hypothetical protein [Xylographa trunciseda]
MGTRQSGTFDGAYTKLLTTLSVLRITSTLTTRAEDMRRVLDQVPGVNSDFKLLKGERLPLACFYETEPIPYGMILVPRSDAIIESDGLGFNENRQIDRNHQNLAKFECSDDPNLRRVLGTMSRLVQHALLPHDVHMSQSQPEPQIPPFATTNVSPPQTSIPVEPATRKLRILSLDGGGVRGLFTVVVLEALMEEVRILTKREDDIKPCDFFDLIGGTSTGGLLALMLSRLRMDLISCKKQYRELSKTIFQKQGWSYPYKTAVDAWFGRAWYPAEPLEVSIKALVAERIRVLEKKELRSCGHAPEEAPLRSEHVSRARCFVCAIRGGERGCARLRSYVSKSGEGDRICAIWQAARATSAAQLYFPPMKIGNETYWDGGSESNNPVQETYEEAFLEFGYEPPLAGIVSIGTGMPVHKDPGTEAREAVGSFIARATDTESIHLRFKRQHPQLKDAYFRLQGSLALGAIDLADWTKLDGIEKMAHDYLESNEGRSAIENCAQHLVPQAGTDEGLWLGPPPVI